MKNTIKLIACVILCLAVGAAGSVFTAGSVDTWYAGLEKPFFNPPDAVFGPVWTVLYILMGISLFLISRGKDGNRYFKPAVLFFGVQLLFNGFWSFAFFGLRSPSAGLAVIVLLWTAILIAAFFAFKVSKTAAFLLAPYLAWVSFAAVLNASILVLNR